MALEAGGLMTPSDKLIAANIVFFAPHSPEDPRQAAVKSGARVEAVISVLKGQRGRKAIRTAVYLLAEQGDRVSEHEVGAALLFYGRNRDAFGGTQEASKRSQQLELS
jgi:hypothetical protein